MGDRKLIEIEQEGRKRVLYGSSQGDRELFVDGIHGIAFAGTHFKVNLYTSVPFGSDEQAERREVVVRLVIPTPAMVSIAQFLFERVNELIRGGVIEIGPTPEQEHKEEPSDSEQ